MNKMVRKTNIKGIKIEYGLMRLITGKVFNTVCIGPKKKNSSCKMKVKKAALGESFRINLVTRNTEMLPIV